MAVNAGTESWVLANCIQKMPCRTMAHLTAPKDQISFCLRPPSWDRVRSIRTFPSCSNTCSLESRRFANICCITTCLSFLEARFGAYRSSAFGPCLSIRRSSSWRRRFRRCKNTVQPIWLGYWVLLGDSGIRLKGIWTPHFFSTPSLSGEILMRSPAMSVWCRERVPSA